MYRIYVWLKSGISLYVGEYPTANDARWWMYAFLKAGYIPIKDDDPQKEYVIPTGSSQLLVAYFQFEAGPEPTQTVQLEEIGGIDDA